MLDLMTTLVKGQEFQAREIAQGVDWLDVSDMVAVLQFWTQLNAAGNAGDAPALRALDDEELAIVRSLALIGFFEVAKAYIARRESRTMQPAPVHAPETASAAADGSSALSLAEAEPTVQGQAAPAHKLIYLASPYSHPNPAIREKRFHAVCAATARLMLQEENRGTVIFSPIAHSHPVAAVGELPTDYLFWQWLDRRMIEACDELWVLKLDGYDTSTGINQEIEHAARVGKHLRWILPHEQDLAYAERRVPTERTDLVDVIRLADDVLDWLIGELGIEHPREWSDERIAEIERRLCAASEGTALVMERFGVVGVLREARGEDVAVAEEVSLLQAAKAAIKDPNDAAWDNLRTAAEAGIGDAGLLDAARKVLEVPNGVRWDAMREEVRRVEAETD